MTQINTTLTTSGNSVAVRLPKELLRMSGLGNKVMLEAKEGKIIISKSINPREHWDVEIQKLLVNNIDPTQELRDMEIASTDGLDELPWDGLSFESWQKNNASLS